MFLHFLFHTNGWSNQPLLYRKGQLEEFFYDDVKYNSINCITQFDITNANDFSHILIKMPFLSCTRLKMANK